ncbi:hypothetical protein LMG29542_07165 [Paraburkholderia humisilvae]|uniref:Uncharacterized protein n=1 Tax=Paraburkholderia humisilvae TaxID=627669 RepID=A0A6J5F3E0_9BURK|nr:hypothetical protein LMG29542_07165 [Paraburkholderia humisilvae]
MKDDRSPRAGLPDVKHVRSARYDGGAGLVSIVVPLLVATLIGVVVYIAFAWRS